MWLAFLGIIAGGLLGSLLSISISVTYAKYLSVAILAAADSLLGGIKGIMENKFDSTLMLSGFFTNALVAAGLALLGDKLGVDLYMVAVLAFGLRIFDNLGTIRRDLLTHYRVTKSNKKQMEMEETAPIEVSPPLNTDTPISGEENKPPEAKSASTIHEALENTILKSETILNPERILELKLEHTIKQEEETIPEGGEQANAQNQKETETNV